MVCHTGGSHFPNGVPILPGKWGPRVPILLGRWGPGSPFSWENGDPGLHLPGKMGIRGPHFRGSPFSHDTGAMKIYTPRKYGHPGVPFLRNFRDPVVIKGTPFSTQTADDTGDATILADTVSLQVKNGQV